MQRPARQAARSCHRHNYKEKHTEKGLPFDGKFYIWDYLYYDNKSIDKELDLDYSLVKGYFPVAVVVPLPELQFSVWDNNSKDENGFLGYCYLDLFPHGTFNPPTIF